MVRYLDFFDMFNGIQVRDLLESQKRDIKSAIEQFSDDEILNRNEVEYVDELLQDHTFECPVINFEGVYVSNAEELIPSEQFPPDFLTRSGKSYPAHIIYYHLPFIGDAELFHNTLSQFSLWFPEVYIEDQEVCFKIIDFRKDMEVVKAEAERIINSIKIFSKALTKDVEMYGIQRTYIESLIQTRKQRLLNNKNLLASLGVPIRKSANRIKSTLTTASNENEKGKRIMPSSYLPNSALEIFYSYSHKDENLRKKLETHLSGLKREGLISNWYDRKIGAGEEWKGQIDAHLNVAQIILLLISADFIASDYCYDIEMKRAMERHETKEARVIPIILRACDWQKTLFGKLQVLPDGKPISGRGWHNQDEAFLDVTQGIRKAVKELTINSESASSVKESQVLSSMSSLEIHRPSDVPEAFKKRLLDAQKSSEVGAMIILARKNEAGEEIHLLKKQKTLMSLNTSRKKRNLLPLGLEVVKSAIVNKYEETDYVFYAATFGDLEPEDYLVYKGQLDDLRDTSRRRGAGVRPGKIYIVDFD